MDIKPVLIIVVGGAVAGFLLAGAVHDGVSLLSRSGIGTLAPAANTATSGQTSPKTSPAVPTTSSSGSASVATGPSSVSSNWSGYVDTSGTYTGISATWTVPDVQQGSSGSVAEWVGIGGTGTSDGLIQAGILENYSGGLLQAQAFTESLPALATPGDAVAPGETVTASVLPTGPDTWTLKVTTGSTVLAQQTVTLTPAQAQAVEQSADWIVEAPSTASGRVLPIASFQTVTFHHATVENAQGQTVSMAAAGPPGAVDLAARYGAAQPGSIAADGESFTVTESAQTPSYGGYGGYGGGWGGGYGGGYGGGFGGGWQSDGW